MGIRDQPTSPRSPWQNGYAENLIGSIRRECLDHVVVLGECHLRHLLLSYMKYYNGTRTHLSLEKDAPFSRAVERAGQILCRPILGGLHHQYVRISLSTGTTAYGDDVPKAEIHFLDAGHFALDEATDEIVSLVRNFLEHLEKHDR
jgi:transposase InsO family protein